ncbi:Flp pilus assembly protein CpaB [Singulisphaera acidiphila]|uniref:Flp pilus assembly protein CpaB n=1 Tax=Singulisphaera acidiphila (strain ATCC BAA-1392 / DSM 18658 / VKM B-2454 / MOB10) TaxID=886293 RepID=L0DAL2_SINAD|nr:Flp pilus assembly protein CpaB [Singulisphaera acidiphila]AGA26297.1 Flp pilus assembly protein CpaB [Singulisphaera acidiphila DSM 18658]
MNGKSLAMLGLAALSGLGAMYGTSRMLAKNQSQVVSETQEVLVAVHDLKVEEILKPESVKVVSMPKASVPAGTFTTYQDVQDRWVLIRTLEGEPILDRKLAPKGSPAGLVSRIHPGMRAFTLEVNEHTGVSGFILPDHRVDVVLSLSNRSGTEEESETILQDIPVLASGQVFTRPDDRSIQSRTVTLEVTPEQVDVLVAARTKGSLSLALRGLNDHVRLVSVKHEHAPAPAPAPVEVAVKPVELPLPPPPTAKPPAPAPERRFVWIYRGQQKPERVSLDKETMDQSGEDAAFPPIDP